MTSPSPYAGHFRVAENPLATTDAIELEALGLELLRRPDVARAAEATALKWKSMVGRDPWPETWPLFDAVMREYVFHHVVKAANSDPNYPRMLRIQMMPHTWFGMEVPGSRLAGDNPDNLYHLAPIDGEARYEITGWRREPAPPYLSITVSGNTAMTRPLALFEAQDLDIGAGGMFTITVGPEPAAGRRNHIHTRHGARFLFFRDSMSDWRQVPHGFHIRRLDPPTAPPRSIDEIAERAADLMLDDVAETYWGMRVPLGFEPNVIGVPFGTGVMGGMATQKLSYSHIQLGNDEAFVATVNDAGAAYRSFVLFNYWLTTNDCANRLGSLNKSQAVSNEDGTITCVVAVEDPGVHNWIDTGGQRHVFLCHRWQGLPTDATETTQPQSSGGIVKLADLAKVLPPSTRWVAPGDRERQYAERMAGYQTRFRDR